MQLKHIIYITLISLLTACSDELTAPTYTVGEAVNAVTLRAGISEGGAGVATRAAEDHHTTPGHVNFTNGTKLTLRVDGTWTGKDGYTLPHGNVSSGAASQETTATTGDKTGNGTLHNKVTFTPAEQLYWDDYGTADPDNASTGRTAGLTIYGVAVDGETTATSVSNWTALSWTLAADQTGGFSKKDLLISNNVTSTADGTYKFDDYVNDLKNSTSNSSNLLEFTHAMSKITVNLVAGEGFPTTGVGATEKKFTAVPEVLLTSNLYGETSKSEWAYTAGTVNVMTGAVSSPNTLAAITTATTKTDDTEFTVIKEALVVPGSAFADNAQVLSILADGNRYYVSSEKMRAAIAAAITASKHPDSYTTQPGKNYVFQVTVNKTGIEVTATIKDWITVEAEKETPIINFSQCYGQKGTDFAKGFTLYRSKTVTGSYVDGLTEGNTSTVSYASAYTMSPQLYWPDHQTHYFFRGVWPQVGTAVGPATGNVKANAIDVTNVTYYPGKYPSDLMIGMPRKADGTTDEHCKSTHNVDGICATDAADGATHATEGLIHLNFEYAMSKVEVRLKSSATDASHINLTKDNTKVEIVGGYNKARIKLSDGLHDAYADATDKGNYTLSNLTTPESDFLVTTRDAIVPQEIGNDVIFRITVTNDNGTPSDTSDDTTDVYQCKVNLINEKNTTSPVTEWAHGKHYIYELDLNKTAIKVTATLKDWVEVMAEDNVWF